MSRVKDLIGILTATTWEICSNLMWLVDKLFVGAVSDNTVDRKFTAQLR